MTESQTLDVEVAELRPALEALLMVADQPLDVATLASAAGHPVVMPSATLPATPVQSSGIRAV